MNQEHQEPPIGKAWEAEVRRRERAIVDAALVQTNRRPAESPTCNCTCPRCDDLEASVDRYREVIRAY